MAQNAEAANAQPAAAPAAPAPHPAPTTELMSLKEGADRGEASSQHAYGVRLWNGTDGSRKDDVEVNPRSLFCHLNMLFLLLSH